MIMSSVIAPNHYPLPPAKDSSCRRQSLSDCCPPLKPLFCFKFSESTGNLPYEKHIPDLKVLAQNIVNALGIKQTNDNYHTHNSVKRPVTTNGSPKNIPSFFDLINCGNRSFKDDIDNGGNLRKEKPSYVYRIMQKEDMKFEKNRLESFRNTWPLSFIDPTDLAAVGFFYLQCGDKVQCAFCRGIIVDWAPGDDPLMEHALHFPLCPFILNRDVGNVPVSGKSPFVERYNNSHPEKSEFVRHRSSRDENHSTGPKFSRMATKEARLGTFRNWQSSAVKPDALVDAGFFYTGTSDIATCFYCGGTLGHWELGDDPVLEHKKHFSQCASLKSKSCSSAKKFANGVEDGISQHAQASQSCDINEIMKSELCTEAKKIFSESVVRAAVERKLNKNGQGFQSLEDLCSTILEMQDESQKNARVESQIHTPRATNSSGDRHLCKICLDKEMGIVFMPCGHMVACPECAQSITKCPLCRKIIESTIRAYMS